MYTPNEQPIEVVVKDAFDSALVQIHDPKRLPVSRRIPKHVQSPESGAPLSQTEARKDAIETVAKTGVSYRKLNELLRDVTDWPTPVLFLLTDFTTVDPISWNSNEVDLYLQGRKKSIGKWFYLPRFHVRGTQLHSMTSSWLAERGVKGEETKFVVNEIRDNLLPPDIPYNPYSYWSPRPGGKMQAAQYCTYCLLALLAIPLYIPCMPFYFAIRNMTDRQGADDCEAALCYAWCWIMCFATVALFIVLGIVLDPLWFCPFLLALPFIAIPLLICIMGIFCTDFGVIFGAIFAPLVSFVTLSVVFFTITAPDGFDDVFFGFAIVYAVGAGFATCWSALGLVLYCDEVSKH